MATIDILTKRTPKTLELISIPLDRGERVERLIYGTPIMMKWLRDDLDRLERGRLKSTETPKDQLYIWLRRWITGKSIVYNKMFKDLMPMNDEVWEAKTVDLRIFGWMYKPCIFIAAFPDYADHYKGRGATATYKDALNKVKQIRNAIDLDEPKYAVGTFEFLIRT
jgi:hypothetical protein